jgi:hypothetical protein
MSDNRPIDVLRDAFLGLLSLAAPAHQEAVLRRAISLTMATEDQPAPGRPLDSRSPPLDRGRWDELRGKIRAVMELRKIGFAILATETALSRSTLEHVLAPSGTAPGVLIAQQLEAWLAGQTGNTRILDLPPEPEPERSQRENSPVAKPIGPRRLSGEERSVLREVYGDMEERELRKRLHCTSDLFERALTGAELPAEAVSRLVGAIAHRLNGANLVD